MAVHTVSYLPFGGGSGRWAGQLLAVVEMSAVIALILKNLSLKLDESKPHATNVEIAYEPIISRLISFLLKRTKTSPY